MREFNTKHQLYPCHLSGAEGAALWGDGSPASVDLRLTELPVEGAGAQPRRLRVSQGFRWRPKLENNFPGVWLARPILQIESITWAFLNKKFPSEY